MTTRGIRTLALTLPLVLGAGAALADTLIAARTIRPREVITAMDLARADVPAIGALSRVEDALGLEARLTIYAGRPIRSGDLAEPAVVERNQIIEIVYDTGAVFIRAEGRALGRGAVGERLRVMNLDSRINVTGTVTAPGQVSVP